MSKGFISLPVLVLILIATLASGAAVHYVAKQRSSANKTAPPSAISSVISPVPSSTHVRVETPPARAPIAQEPVRPSSRQAAPPSPSPTISVSSSLPLYDRTVCPDTSEGDKVFIRNGVRYRTDDEVRRWAEEFCGPNAAMPLIPFGDPERVEGLPPPLPSEPLRPTCESNVSPVFTNDITDMSRVNYIGPPPTMGAGPSLKTHSYIGTDHARVPVYAPAAMTLESGSHYVGGPYMMEFRVSCEVNVRFGHITEPVEAIKNLLPSEPKQDSRTEVLPPLTFAAGELVGYTTGTSAAGNWDYGVYNSAVRNRYGDDPNWSNSTTYTTAVCPFDYFSDNLRAAYVAKFNSAILGGNPSHGEPFCKI